MIGAVVAAALGYGYGVCRIRGRGRRSPATTTDSPGTWYSISCRRCSPRRYSRCPRRPTLALRVLPRSAALALGRILHRLRHLATIWAATVMTVAGLVLLYRTPVYALSNRYPWLHVAVHLHLLVTGCLFACATCGFVADCGGGDCGWTIVCC